MTEVLTILGWLSVAQAALVATAVLIRRGERHPAVPVLGAVLLTGAGALAAILVSHRIGGHWSLSLVEMACTVLNGPLVYAWVARTLEDQRRARLRRHLVVPSLFLAYELGGAVLPAGGALAGLPQPPLAAVLLFQMAYTAAAATLLVRRWREPEAVGRRGWLALIVALLAVVHLASLARFVIDQAPPDLVPAAAVLLMYAVGFAALRQPRSLRLAQTGGSDESGADAAEDAAEPDQPRYRGSPLGAEQVAALRERLLASFGADRPWLRPDITLPELARELDTLPTHLSRAVNEGGESFPDLLARYRVEEARRLLADPTLDHLTVEALGRRAGFRSRSAFHEAFRRRTGTTPSAYRRDRGERSPD